ncbi:amidohydrolase [Nakamurella leprariae]|uniref:Amidohydrolase n=1 Tax=Nakamurella leprariae TaxID=2803911 RepID=A0A938YHQ4_9ACTN|nr:amidohydrolase [Nakamurella leprariae]MBM9468562.1 amidohydrolase [Nakamurella leprariae]
MSMLAITNATVLTGTGQIIEGGDVLVDGTRIAAVGAGLAVPDGATVIDGTGRWVTPGLIDVHTHISVKAEPAWTPSVSDVTEITSPITPAVRALDALNPADAAIPVVRAAGFTTVCALPGSGNVIGGQNVVFKTREATTVHDLVLDAPVQIKFALGENPKRIHGIQQNKTPLTRMGTAAMLRETLTRARTYSDRLLAAERGSAAPDPDFQLEPLVPVVRGERTCRIHSHRADDIVTATRIAEEFGLRFVIDHATESWKIADFLAERGVTCIVGPLDMAPEKQETWNARLDTAVLLERAGVRFCLTQDSRSGTRFLPFFVGAAIARGLPLDAALRAVTSTAAQVLGIDDRTGSIEVGKDADLALFSGHPFSSLSVCEHTVIDGVVHANRPDDRPRPAERNR